MSPHSHRLTKGYVARHIPPQSNIGVDIAILDIAQDFLLAHLHGRGIFDLVTFKGGTALRKLYAGRQGRFSTDIDFAALEVGANRASIAEVVAHEVAGSIGPFTFTTRESRGRWHIGVSSEFGNPALEMRLDVGAPTWIQREERGFIPIGTHKQYGIELPTLPSMRLEEVLAEKIARLSRLATARDASDLIWAATTSPYSQFSRPRVRRLAVLKIWVDNHGMQPGWSPALACGPFDPAAWLEPRKQWDDEQIGTLASPPPSLKELERGLERHYGWLRELTAEEQRWARADSRSRGEVLAAIRDLEDGALRYAGTY